MARGNRLGDAAGEAERVAGLGELREVALAGNPLARRPVGRRGAGRGARFGAWRAPAGMGAVAIPCGGRRGAFQR